MALRRLLREPELCIRMTVYVCAGVLFPLHLGWTGTSWLGFLAYLVIASFLISATVIVMEEPRQAPKWQALLLVAVVALGISALPAALAFSIGRIVGPVDEALDERMCSSQGLAESDSVYAEANDIVDATPDCAVREP